MATYVTKVRTEDGDLQIDYNALANLPKSDTTLTKSGSFADAKATGDAISDLEDVINDSLKSDVETLGSNITIVQTSVNELNTAVTNLTAGAARIEENLELKADKTVVDDLSATVTTINNAVSGHAETIAEHTSQIESMSNSVAPIDKGGTGATTALNALKNLGIVYSTSQPSNPQTGMIWLKPV